MVLKGGSQQDIAIAKFRNVDEIGKKLSVAIENETVQTDHQHTSLGIHKVGHGTERRLECQETASVVLATGDEGTGTCLPELSLAVEMDMAVEVVAFSIAGHFGSLLVVQPDAEESVAGGTYQQMAVVFLQDVVHAGSGYGVELDLLKGICGGMIARQSDAGTHPQLSFTVDKERRDVVADHGGRVSLFMEIIGETVAVVLIQSVFGTNPHIPRPVLTDTADQVARQLF